MKKFLLFIILLTNLFKLYSQEYNIKGKVLDSKNKDPLVSANVLLSMQNSSKKTGTFTDKNGNFEIKNLSPVQYTIKISYVGYKHYEKKIQLINKDLYLGEIFLQADSIILKEVTSIGKLPIAEQKEDTVQYIANSYKMNKDASTEDLVQKMPGITVDRSTIKAQGENVRQVLVDGRQFFDQDPMAALRNLPAEIVEKVQVYDKQSEQAQFTGFDDGQTTKVMNIITRQRMRNGQFGKFTGGYGNEKKYQASGILNLFNNFQRISIVAQSNNINNQNFSIEDVLGTIGGGLRGGGIRMGGQGMRIMRQGSLGREIAGRIGIGMGGGRGSELGDFMVNQQDGISSVHAFGINYSDSWSDKIQFTGSYFFNLNNNDADKDLNRSYLLTSGLNQNYSENTISDSKNINHRLNFRFEYSIDTTSKLLIQPRLTFQSNDGSSLTNAQTRTTNILSNKSINDFSSNLSAYNFSNEIVYNKRLSQNGRSISIGLNTSYNNNLGDNNQTADNIFFGQNTIYDSLIQTSHLDKNGYRISSNILYTEPIVQNHFIQVSYNISDNINKSDKKSFNIEQQRSILDSALSNVFENKYWTHRIGTSYGYQTKEVRLSLGIFYNLNKFDNSQEFPYYNAMNRSFKNILPSAMLRYRFSERQNMQFFYIAQANLPSIDQLQNVLDNSNQLQLSIGNSNLKEEISHNFNLRYSSVTSDFTNTFFFMINTRFSKDYIGRNTIFADKDTTVLNNIFLYKGTQLTYPKNLNNYLNLNSFIGYGTSIPILKSSINFNTMLTYSRTPNSINDIVSFSDSKSAGLGITLSSNMSEDFDFTLSTNYSYNSISGSNMSTGNTNYSNYYIRLRLNYTFLDNFVFQSNANYQYFYGLSNNYNPENLLVNLSFGKKFLSNNQAEIKFGVYDMFNSSRSTQRNSTELYVEDVKTNVLNRYYMLTFSYNLRAFGSE